MLGLMNTAWAIILPGSVSAWYMIITRTYFTTIPESLFESASLDGASELKKLLVIAVPLAMPIIAVLALYMIVGYWNTYFSALLYLDDVKLHPLQNYLDKILFNDSFSGGFGQGSDVSGAIQIEQIKYSAIVVAMFPIMVIYPFLQRFFVKGIMLGSIKE
jgi:putative aldouronate transport system permease protein